ncbi:MAG: response regulator, partial [Acidobacteria bacterium]|nr:response regulator [Acidobacteriota bacterium]
MDYQRRKVNNGPEILIVEDSPTQAEQLKHLLEEQGYSVRRAANGKEALAAVGQRKPTLIITDVLMPGMDGFTLCKEIKSRGELNDVPVVLMTSLSSPQDVMKGLACGADNFIRKPYEEKYLLKRIEFILA